MSIAVPDDEEEQEREVVDTRRTLGTLRTSGQLNREVRVNEVTGEGAWRWFRK